MGQYLGHIFCVLYKSSKFRVAHFMYINIEAVECDVSCWTFTILWNYRLVTAHLEGAIRYKHHLIGALSILYDVTQIVFFLILMSHRMIVLHHEELERCSLFFRIYFRAPHKATKF